MKTVVITGASAGLGRLFLDEVFGQIPSVEEVWIIARRKERLDALAASYPDKRIIALPVDLTDEKALDAFDEFVQKRAPNILALINNAGFGTMGNLEELPRKDEMREIDLNVRGLTAVTSICLPHMRAGSAILNVCSIAAFGPTPRMTVYSSTKAFVFSFTRALREELRARGINVCAVCPGPMRTEFLSVAGIEKGSSKTFDTLPYCDPAKVVRDGLSAALSGKAVCTNTAFYKLYRVLAKLIPQALFVKFTRI